MYLNVYEAGSITQYQRENNLKKAIDWRIKASNFLITNINNCDIFDPTVNFEKNCTYDPRGVVLQNVKYLKESNLLLLNLEYLEKSPGTIFELTYAYLNQIPVVAFGELDKSIEGNPHILESISMRFDTLKESLDYIYDMYGQE